MIVIGLTGGIAAGKTTVSKTLRRLGATIWDADEASRKVVRPGKPGALALKEAFGEDIFDAGGTLNRKKLAAEVFGKPEMLQKLNQALHPIILEDLERHLKFWENQGIALVVVDAPLLFETGADRYCDEVWVVSCGVDEQLRRLMARDQLSMEDALKRIESQMPDRERRARARRVIDTIQPPEAVESYVTVLYEELLEDGL